MATLRLRVLLSDGEHITAPVFTALGVRQASRRDPLRGGAAGLPAGWKRFAWRQRAEIER
ncbi:hypothetical protein FLL57_22910 [Rhodopseudomonas palustris]|uniref:hypothetical protein n=1 Tax=Rhodopseudomonas palustris TaxID=1076 RepID=UPI00115DC433|nr:hypothetical protein [Rhodopseudomonas palustris]QDL99990.1 hypothetical protein FLL57_22910 [Rhodopseudomonas palustris]